MTFIVSSYTDRRKKIGNSLRMVVPMMGSAETGLAPAPARRDGPRHSLTLRGLAHKEALRWARAEARPLQSALQIVQAWTHACMGETTGGHGYLGGFDSSSVLGVENNGLQRAAEEPVDRLIGEVAVLGSASQQCAHHAPYPVAVVHPAPTSVRDLERADAAPPEHAARV